MPQLQKGYKNNKNHRLSIDDALVKWAGWPMGPYGGKDETYEVKDAKGKVTETKLKGNLTEVAPYINVEQHEEYNISLI